MRTFLAILTLAGALATAAAATKPVQFVVLVPDLAADQPKQIYVASSADGWREQGQPLPRIAPGVYSATFEYEVGAEVTYKFSREGSWATVEKGAVGQELPNRTLTADATAREQVIVCRVEKWADRAIPADRRLDTASAFEKGTAGGAAPTPSSTLTGLIRYHHGFRSPQLNNERTLIVYLPPGYEADTAERYPVLYMHDGQNIFDAKTSFAGEWSADETAERLIRAGQLRKLIIVGVYNNADRFDEYTPFADAARGGGRGDAYLAFLVETVKPFIDKTYRTLPDRDNTGIAGSSLGGLISLYAAYKYPDVFGGAGVISPTLNWADGAVLRYVAEHKPPQPPRLWIDVGTAERDRDDQGDASALLKPTRDLVQILEKSGLHGGTDFRYEEIPGGRHNEADWARRLDQILVFLFPASPTGEH